MTDGPDKLVIGSAEWCAFPNLGIPAIKARVDSGAKTSSIHAFNIQRFRRRGEAWVSFEVHPLQNDRKSVVRCECPVLDRRSVKSSTGIKESRYVIRTAMRLGPYAGDIELTLANRDSMGFRMLLGREAMIDRMLVDPSSSFHLGQVSDAALAEWYGRRPDGETGLRIGLLATDPGLYSNKRLLEAGEERGHEMTFLNIQDCFMKLDNDAPEVYLRGGSVLRELDAVITRIRPGLTRYGCALARQFEIMGVYTLNSAAAVANARDPLQSLQLVLKHGVPIPTTGCADSSADTAELVEMVGGAPLMVKLLRAGPGRSLLLRESGKVTEHTINMLRSLHPGLLLQQFVRDADGKALRCLVIDGKVVAAVRHMGTWNEGAGGRERGASVFNLRISAQERSLAIQAARALGLKVAGVDIIRSKNGPLLLKVSSTPALEEIETVTGKDVAGLMVAAIEKKLGWQLRLAVEPS